MTQVKHTPGPWSWSESGENAWMLTTVDGEEFAEIYFPETKPTNPANARLIASAPELLEICKQVREDCLMALEGTWDKMDKRLLKDLPFGDLVKGTIVAKNGNYEVFTGYTYYDVGCSDNVTHIFTGAQKEILDIIWDNEDWFTPAVLKHIDFKLSKDKIILEFDSLSFNDVDSLAKGIIHLLPNLQIGSWTWNKFKDITTQLRNY